MKASAKLVVIMGTQYYDGSGLGASDYPVTDLLQMLGRASRPGIDEVREATCSAKVSPKLVSRNIIKHIASNHAQGIAACTDLQYRLPHTWLAGSWLCV